MSAERQTVAATESRRASRGAHVFAVAARAIPVPTAAAATLRGEVDVALLAPPTVGVQFPIRVPRGSIEVGALFIVRCRNGRETQLSLVRALAVSEPAGLGFDLVHARVETATGSEDPLERAPTRAAASGRRPTRGISEESLERLHSRGCATAVEGVGVATISQDTSVAVLSAVVTDGPLKLAGPRGAITPDMFFALRYFDASGAKRGIVRAQIVSAKPGMIDEIVGVLVGAPTAAPERQSYRAPFDLFFTATVETRASRRVVGRLIDLSSSGVGFRINATLEPGERLRIADPSLPHLDGAELLVVRTDPLDRLRHGARFAVRDRGAVILTTMLGLDRAERAHRRRIQLEAIRRGDGGTASPVTEREVKQFLKRGMTTRARLHDRERDRT